MSLGSAWHAVIRFLVQPHRDVKSFEREVEGAGIVSRVDGGMKTIPTAKVVGSVGRAANLRSDFFYKTGRVTARFVRIGQAMKEGKILPPIEVYKARLQRKQERPGALGEPEVAKTEYYVVDGHHRVAMARKLGQDYLDAHVVEYKVQPAAPDTSGRAAAEPPDALPSQAPEASKPAGVEMPAAAPPPARDGQALSKQ